jgi:2-oxoglutarate dehydrogenase E2 component (dihydrolipoamide succinyltransferase)
MKVVIKVPSVGESVVEATIGAVLKQTGSIVHADEEILEIETEKVNQVIYAPAAGQINLVVKQGDRVQVGQEIGHIDTEANRGETVPSTKEQVTVRSPTPISEEKRTELPPQPGIRKKMSGLRRVIAQRLVQVKNETAMLTTFNEVDLSKVIAEREREQEKFLREHGVKLGFMSFFVQATVSALKAFPDLNAQIEGDEIVYPQSYDLGIAVSTEKGLFVPVVRRAESLSQAQIEQKIKELAEKARKGTISIDELQGGTFTITNGGVYGSMLSTPILNPPQSGILGMHNIVKRPVVVDDQIVIRPIMYLALSYDHRIVDGKEAISFLVHIKDYLERSL